MPLPAEKNDKSFLPWLCRSVTTIRGKITFEIVSCLPFASFFSQRDRGTHIIFSAVLTAHLALRRNVLQLSITLELLTTPRSTTRTKRLPSPVPITSTSIYDGSPMREITLSTDKLTPT
jgi:hypothetical protein